MARDISCSVVLCILLAESGGPNLASGYKFPRRVGGVAGRLDATRGTWTGVHARSGGLTAFAGA